MEMYQAGIQWEQRWFWSSVYPYTCLWEPFSPGTEWSDRERESWSAHLTFWLFRGLFEGLVSFLPIENANGTQNTLNVGAIENKREVGHWIAASCCFIKPAVPQMVTIERKWLQTLKTMKPVNTYIIGNLQAHTQRSYIHRRGMRDPKNF